MARDLGEAAGTGAHLAGLVRTANGSWTVDQAVSLTQLEQAGQEKNLGWKKHLHPPDQLVTHLPKVTLSETQAVDVEYGRQIHISSHNIEPQVRQEATINYLRAYTPAKTFLAILKKIDQHENLWQPKKVFHL